MLLRTINSVGFGEAGELHPPGSTVEIPDNIADYLVAKGAAIPEKEAPKKSKADLEAEAKAKLETPAAIEHPKDTPAEEKANADAKAKLTAEAEVPLKKTTK